MSDSTTKTPSHLSTGSPGAHNFGSRAPFSLGVEEELLLVDADHRLIEEGAEEVRRGAHPVNGEVDAELFEPMVEGNSPVCATPGEAVAALSEVRRELIESGARLIGAGLHPTAAPGEAQVHAKPRYELIEYSLQGVLRTPICGLHVHVGMPDETTAVRAYNGIRLHVPLLNAMAANSPFWYGEDSGLASARTVIFRSYPRAAMAPEFDDYAHFRAVTKQVCDAGGLADYTQIWWDVRLHPNLGTVEIRAADTQFDLQRVAALAAFVHCLTMFEAERDPDELPAREALAESSFQATRHGLDAKLLDRSGQVVPARELGMRTLHTAAPFAGLLGCEHELERAERILEEGSGADIQRRVQSEHGMDGLLEFLVEETSALD